MEYVSNVLRKYVHLNSDVIKNQDVDAAGPAAVGDPMDVDDSNKENNIDKELTPKTKSDRKSILRNFDPLYSPSPANKAKSNDLKFLDEDSIECISLSSDTNSVISKEPHLSDFLVEFTEANIEEASDSSLFSQPDLYLTSSELPFVELDNTITKSPSKDLKNLQDNPVQSAPAEFNPANINFSLDNFPPDSSDESAALKDLNNTSSLSYIYKPKLEEFVQDWDTSYSNSPSDNFESPANSQEVVQNQSELPPNFPETVKSCSNSESNKTFSDLPPYVQDLVHDWDTSNSNSPTYKRKLELSRDVKNTTDLHLPSRVLETSEDSDTPSTGDNLVECITKKPEVSFDKPEINTDYTVQFVHTSHCTELDPSLSLGKCVLNNVLTSKAICSQFPTEKIILTPALQKADFTNPLPSVYLLLKTLNSYIRENISPSNAFLPHIEHYSENLTFEQKDRLRADRQADLLNIFDAAMQDLTENNDLLEQDVCDLRLQLNQSQQARATLELQVRQKEELIIKTQVESQKKEIAFRNEVKLLHEKLAAKDDKNAQDSRIRELEETVDKLKAKDLQSMEQIRVLNANLDKFRTCIDEYDGQIQSQLDDLERTKREYSTTKRHLANLEIAFSDVHQKYERCKVIIEGYKNNEDTFQNAIDQYEAAIKKQDEKYQSLKAHAMAQIEKCNNEVATGKEKYEAEIVKLNAIIKRLQIKLDSVTNSLDQKTKECEGLAELCDEVTGKVN